MNPIKQTRWKCYANDAICFKRKREIWIFAVKVWSQFSVLPGFMSRCPWVKDTETLYPVFNKHEEGQNNFEKVVIKTCIMCWILRNYFWETFCLSVCLSCRFLLTASSPRTTQSSPITTMTQWRSPWYSMLIMTWWWRASCGRTCTSRGSWSYTRGQQAALRKDRQSIHRTALWK